MKNNKGFSLVELIVVIAIMAVLAAVAVIGLSIYIPKAQQAADDELLHDINYILELSCNENGVDVRDVTSATWDKANNKVTSVKVNGVENDDIVTSVNAHLADIDKIEFVLEDDLSFDKATAKFVFGEADGSSGGVKEFEYAGGKIVVDEEDLEALENSTFGDMGMEVLLGELDKVAGLATEIGNEAFTDILVSEDFQRSAAEALGIDTNDADWKDQLADKQAGMVADLMAKDPTLTQAQAEAKISANATVLYTAKQTANLSDSDIDSLLTNPTKEGILLNMKDEPSKGLSQAALLCGLYTSYINSADYVGPANPTVGVGEVLDALDDEAFIKYINGSNGTGQGAKDKAGYLSSLNMINSSTSNNPGAVEQLMVNGFADQELIDGMNSVTGN